MGLNEGDGRRKPAPLLGWALPAVIAAVTGACLAGGDATRLLLRFDRDRIAAGDVWRLLSGHFVHLGASHWLLNVAGLALTWYLVGDAFDWRRWLVTLVVTVAAIDAGLWFLDPGLHWYVGLSGVLHGMLTAGIVALWKRRRFEAILLAAVIAAKIAWEQLAGPLPGSELSSGGTVVVDAHLYGAVGGAVAALALIRRRRDASI